MNTILSEKFANEIADLKSKYPGEKASERIEDSINIFRGLRQDFTINDFNDYEKNWIKRCAVELIERGSDRVNISSYSENGYSETYFTDLISNSLRREIFPKLKTF